MDFPKNFVWGAAAASYQVEGAAFEDGKGPSVWDAFCRMPGRVLNGHTGDVACDHYHRYAEDVALMKQLNLQAYRFSISWPRVLPTGRGKLNQKGMDFYKALVDELLQAGIQPYATLFHWDYPLALYDRGGWLNPDSADWFAEYCAMIVKELPQVKNYFTLNEPQCFIGLGFGTGVHAPGQRLSARDTLLMSKHVLLGHGKAVANMRAAASAPVSIGYAPTASFAYPATNDEKDIEAARQAVFGMPKDVHQWTWNVSWWSDPVLLGKLPQDAVDAYGAYLPEITQDDLKTMNQKLDFLGQNIYNGPEVRMGGEGVEYVERLPGYPRTCLNWPVTPDALYWGPRFLYERYGLPVYITENGLACHDWVSLDGKVHDPNRIDFTQRYLRCLGQAAADGVDVRGYFHWSTMDNFEWHSGYTERFGLVYVDFTTQERIIKDSGYWYAKVIESNGANL